MSLVRALMGDLEQLRPTPSEEQLQAAVRALMVAGSPASASLADRVRALESLPGSPEPHVLSGTDPDIEGLLDQQETLRQRRVELERASAKLSIAEAGLEKRRARLKELS
jgi:hypothetical protein